MSDTSKRVLSEFIESNLDKEYPLMDECVTAGGFAVPSSFLADLTVCIGLMDNAESSSFRYNTRVSNITVYQDYIYVSISSIRDGEEVLIAKSDPIPTSINVGTDIEDKTIILRPAGDIPINGTIVVGTCEDINKIPGYWDIQEGFGYLFPANVVVVPTTVTGIIVDDHRLTGDIIIEAGDNVAIDYDDRLNKIIIDTVQSEYTIPEDSDIMEAIVEKFGEPIISINGVTPDSKGNIKITPTDCLSVETSLHTISFTNPCGTTCASEEFMSDTYIRLSDLNRSYSTLVSFYNSVSNTLAQMGVRVSAALEKQ
jgi:hypothetical protein